jgi:hypothetical protein
VSPADLRDHFELVLGIYARNDGGRLLVEWFKTDWGMFEHERMDDAHAQVLLSDILDDGEIVRRRFVPAGTGRSESLHRWQEFREELMHKNRYFPKAAPDLVRLRELLSYLITDPREIPSQLFRARIQDGAMPHPPDRMGAPPAELATHGRANPAGIPYLYLASDQNTAVSELRPHTGDLASVARCLVSDQLKLVDLRQPRKTISPFALPDESQVALLRGDLAFLATVGEELTRPVHPKSAHIDYLPSQYLCEFIKDCGFDGVMYRSSVGDGVNLALFDPAKAAVDLVAQYAVSRVHVELEEKPSAPGGERDVPAGATR